jgi:hypothetical protein
MGDRPGLPGLRDRSPAVQRRMMHCLDSPERRQYNDATEISALAAKHPTMHASAGAPVA